MSDHDEKSARPAYPKAALLASPLLLIVGITLYEVVSRYLFGSPTIWVNEAALFLSALVYLVAGVYVMALDDHLRISVIYDVVPRPVQRLFDLITLAAALVFCGGVAWFGAPSAWRSLVTFERFGTAWNPPIPAIVKPFVVVAAALMALFAIVNFIRSGRQVDRADDRID
ncbi:TRAP-type mannitol/chloroaromatic compound transport system, small permease component (plasmid) [Hartmannibacter diazotrophicus]|uniref:TRAP transporter small permease protein n=1 Tax=Hartmannibacter diazotrophicus TaxID=1482074 RepID=A0A2C9DE78_9HYPH|nr:TRAP transporter small permease [Hartmannibacter diazotrophicus]SON58498.1 TRAP-type mannitol/chloroaromatic compound transport system, small permease component [Hartmannibacter diazotrophicus]